MGAAFPISSENAPKIAKKTRPGKTALKLKKFAKR
jgi:hypothetical protein